MNALDLGKVEEKDESPTLIYSLEFYHCRRLLDLVYSAES